MSEQKFETRVTRLTVGPSGESLFSERVTHVEIDDDAGGEYIKVIQDRGDTGGVNLDPDEWPAVRDAINRIAKECRG